MALVTFQHGTVCHDVMSLQLHQSIRNQRPHTYAFTKASTMNIDQLITLQNALSIQPSDENVPSRTNICTSSYLQDDLKQPFKVKFPLMFLSLFLGCIPTVFFIRTVNRETADKAAGPDLASPCRSMINRLRFMRTSEQRCETAPTSPSPEQAVLGKPVN